MICRVCWFAVVGVLASLISHGISLFEAPFVIVELVRRMAPAVALWLLFRHVLENRVWTRLIFLLVLFHFIPPIVYLFWRIPLFAAIWNSPVAESSLLLLIAITIPVALGTPSAFRSSLRIGLGACLIVAIQAAFFAMTDPLVNYGAYRFGIVFGLAIVRWSLVFAALAPDHIAMQRAARARELPLSCEKCAYDLTGNVSGVCPECGTALSEAVRQRLQQRSTNQQAAKQVSAVRMDTE